MNKKIKNIIQGMINRIKFKTIKTCFQNKLAEKGKGWRVEDSS